MRRERVSRGTDGGSKEAISRKLGTQEGVRGWKNFTCEGACAAETLSLDPALSLTAIQTWQGCLPSTVDSRAEARPWLCQRLSVISAQAPNCTTAKMPLEETSNAVASTRPEKRLNTSHSLIFCKINP